MKLLITATSALILALLLWGVATVVSAQEGVPPPYAGLKNPFPWSDPAVQQEGKKLYQQTCLGCHGTAGSNLPTANFGAANFPKQLEEKADFYFWITSEGRMSKGMPPFKSSLSDEQRWQVITYLWSLGKSAPAKETPAPAKDGAAAGGEVLSLNVPQLARAGQALILAATLRDAQGKSIEDATVTFLVKEDFFISGLMEIGRRQTDDKGTASIKYIPKETSQIEVVARYKTVETKSVLNVSEGSESFYRPEAGIDLPAPGAEVFIGPGAQGLNELGEAPTFALRLPGGILSWLLLFVATIMLVWGTYFRVIYQVFRIPIRREITDTDTRLIPMIGLFLVVAVGIFLVLKLITGPSSHPHLMP